MNYEREEQLNIPIDDNNRTITISKIFDPKKTNPTYKFILESNNSAIHAVNSGNILPHQLYNNIDDFIALTKNCKPIVKEITIPFSYDLDLCFIKLYLNMYNHHSQLEVYQKLMETDNHIKSISYRFNIFQKIISDSNIILQFYDAYKETKLLIYDLDHRDSIHPNHNPLKKIINQCMKDINKPPKTPSKTKKKNVTKKDK